MIRSYSELVKLQTFEERFNYLKLDGVVSEQTFGSYRYLNQEFYHSDEWRRIRKQIILRDSDGNNVLDIATPDYPILGRVYIHHINPIEVRDANDIRKLLDPENLVCVSFDTHQAIHYGTTDFLQNQILVERSRNDTAPWKGGY
jgi:hypothetical protein